jgi:hypothetical protein
MDPGLPGYDEANGLLAHAVFDGQRRLLFPGGDTCPDVRHGIPGELGHPLPVAPDMRVVADFVVAVL